MSVKETNQKNKCKCECHIKSKFSMGKDKDGNEQFKMIAGDSVGCSVCIENHKDHKEYKKTKRMYRMFGGMLETMMTGARMK